MIQSINFMGGKQAPIGKIAKKVEPEMKGFFPHTEPIAAIKKTELPHGLTKTELESYLNAILKYPRGLPHFYCF